MSVMYETQSGVTLNFTELASILDIIGSNPLPLAESLSTVMQELKLKETNKIFCPHF